MAVETPGSAKKTEAHSGDHWVEREALVLEKQIFQFQYNVAKEIARITGMSVLEAVVRYTSHLRTHAFPYPHDDAGRLRYGVSAGHLVDGAYEDYTTYIAGGKHRYHPETWGEVAAQYGCFSYDIKRGTKKAHMHFDNREYDPTHSPLSFEQRTARLQELHDLFAHMRQYKGDVETVMGNSWLYNLHAYRSLFPREYTAHRQPVRDVSTWKLNGVWGQFIQADHTLNKKRAEQLMTALRAAHAGDDIETVLYESLPLKVLSVRGPVNAFYDMYGIEHP
jgi:hypothetical protein